MLKFVPVSLLAAVFSVTVWAEEIEDHTQYLMDHGDGHLMEMSGGMVMGQNADKLPGGCDKISETKEITVHAGHKYAEKFPGRMYAFDTQEFNFEPCTKLTVHFVNEDNIRHQWMMHGLPKYLYAKGMFHLEVSGPGKISGTLILPPGDKTYLVHCDIAQHMEKGMKAQLKVGKGDGDLPSIPGVTAPAVPDDYTAGPTEIFAAAKQTELDIVAANEAMAKAEAERKANKQAAAQSSETLITGTTVIGLVLGIIVSATLGRRYKGKTVVDATTALFSDLRKLLDYLIGLLSKLLKTVLSSNNKSLPSK